MKLSDKLLKAFNEQIQKEYDSAYIYKGMEMYFADLGIDGFKHFFNKQAKEEVEHAEKFENFVWEVDGKVELEALNKPEQNYNSIVDVFKAGLEHEKFVSQSIRDLLAIAIEEKHYAAENFLRGFVDEQVEEEDTFRGIVDMLEFVGDDKAAIFKINSMLGER